MLTNRHPIIMKKNILILLIASFIFNTQAQITTPAPSPFQKIEQRVGLTDVTVEYSRPGVKGRKIFGELLDYGKIWRTGANASTKISFSTDFTIAGKKLEKGTYALYTIPNKDSWDIILYTDTSNWGSPKKLDKSKIATKVTVSTKVFPMLIETLTITFDYITSNSAVLGVRWENTSVGFKFETPTDSIVAASIKKTMIGNPTANDLYAAAVYYLQTGKDIKKAQSWIDKAIEMSANKPKFWYLRQQALIHAKAGNHKKAIAAAKESLTYAEKAGNTSYIKMNRASLKEWETK